MTKYELKNARMKILYNLLIAKLAKKPKTKDGLIDILQQFVFESGNYPMYEFLNDTTYKELETVAEWYTCAYGIKE